jgi:hypothetical protein
MAFTFKNEDDANMCISRAEKRGVKYELLDRFSFGTNHLEKGSEVDDDAMHEAMNVSREKMWVVKFMESCPLKDGFLPINELVRSISRSKMSDLWSSLTHHKDSDGGQHQFVVCGFVTDAIYFKRFDGGKVEKEMLPQDIREMIGDGIGKCKFSEDNGSKVPKAFMRQSDEDVKRLMFSDDSARTEIIQVSETLDQQEVFSFVQPLIRNRTVLFGSAGTGKTYNVLAHVTNKFCPDQVLVVTAWNSQARNIKASFPTIKDAITWHMLKGERIDGHTNERNAFDVSQKKAIVIDEIMLFEYRKIVKLFHFMESHPEIEFFATGDEAQLEAIDDVVSNEHKMDVDGC